MPNLKPLRKVKLTAQDGSKVRKVAFVNFRNKSGEHYLLLFCVAGSSQLLKEMRDSFLRDQTTTLHFPLDIFLLPLALGTIPTHAIPSHDSIPHDSSHP